MSKNLQPFEPLISALMVRVKVEVIAAGAFPLSLDKKASEGRRSPWQGERAVILDRERRCPETDDAVMVGPPPHLLHL